MYSRIIRSHELIENFFLSLSRKTFETNFFFEKQKKMNFTKKHHRLSISKRSNKIPKEPLFSVRFIFIKNFSDQFLIVFEIYTSFVPKTLNFEFQKLNFLKSFFFLPLNSLLKRFYKKTD